MQRGAVIATFPPSAFAVVMATGIVGIAAYGQSLPGVGAVLVVLSAVALLVCWALFAARAVRAPMAVLADIRSHAVAPGFFTIVAGTAVVGSGARVAGLGPVLPIALLGASVAAWFVLTYSVFTGLAIAQEKSLPDGIDGGWLLAVVATQSLAVLGALLSPGLVQPYRLQLNFFAVCAWLFGGVLYTWLMTLIVYRTLFFRVEPADVRPSWWINMGAMAISALAGALLMQAAADAPLLEGMLPVLRGATLLYWATGTWWIPLLVVLHLWRYVVRGERMRYSLAQWSAVFPLGMYSVANEKLAGALQLGFLSRVATVFFWAAIVAWGAAAVGFARRK